MVFPLEFVIPVGVVLVQIILSSCVVKNLWMKLLTFLEDTI